MPHALDGFDQDAEGSARYFEQLGMEVYARLLRETVRLLATGPEFHAMLAKAWDGRQFHAVYDRPLLLCAALRLGALGDASHPLAGAIGKGRPAPELVMPEAIALAVGRSDTQEALARRSVQTNEVTRAIAWRLTLGCVPGRSSSQELAGARGEVPVVLVDLGCSAALNLVADRIDLGWTDPQGAPIELVTTLRVVERIGLDRHPIDARDPTERAWLRACIWPGQDKRLARLDAAFEAASTALDRGELKLLARAAPHFPDELRALRGDAFVLAYQTVFVEYLSPEDRAAYQAGMRAWLETRGSRAVWVEFERASSETLVVDSARGPNPVAIRAHTASATFILGSCEYHPTSIAIDKSAVDSLSESLRSI
jgi:hypothetical protein